MSLSKSIRHCRRQCVLHNRRYFQTESSPEDVSKMSVRNVPNNNQWKMLNQLKEFLQKVKIKDNMASKLSSGVALELNKELASVLQRIKPTIYGSQLVRDFGSKTELLKEDQRSQSSSSVTSSTEPSIPVVTDQAPQKNTEGYYRLPSVFNAFYFSETKDRKISTDAPKWKVQQQNVLISKSSISSRTNHVISMITTAESPPSLLKRIEALSEHLSSFPDAKNQAVKGGAIRVLLRLREQPQTPQIQSAIAEAFSRLGYTDPPSGRGIRILSIDGGGIRGLVVIEMLRKIEQLTGRKIYELFDYVCGVSTGAILTASIVINRRNLDDVAKYYKDLSTKIFTQNALLGTSNLVLKQSYYDTAMWEMMLKEHLGDVSFIETSRDTRCPKSSVVSAVVNQSQISAFVFRNYALPYRVCSQYMGSNDCAVWQAVRASAAAPTYFEEFMLDGYLHQDGGIMVNNPTAIAIHEAKQLWPDHPIQCVLSFGTGRAHPVAQNKDETNMQAMSSSWKNKFLKILDSATDTEGVHTVLNDLLEPNVYYRFNPYLTESVSMVEIRPDKIAQIEQDAAMYLRRNEDKFEQAAKQLTLQRDSKQRLSDWLQRQQIILGLKSTV